MWCWKLYSREYGEEEFGMTALRLDSYAVQTKRTERCRTWDTGERWGSIDRREDTMPAPPPIPDDVRTELHSRLREEVARLPIKVRGG